MRFNVTINEKEFRLDLVGDSSAGRWSGELDGVPVEIDAARPQADVLSLLFRGRSYEIRREQAEAGLRIWVEGRAYAAEVRDPRSFPERRRRSGADSGARHLLAPMPGKVIRFLVAQDAEVEAGQGVVVVEAMKMQNEIRSPKKGTVRTLAVAEGAAVNAGDVLAVVE